MATQAPAPRTIYITQLIIMMLTAFLVYENPKIARAQTPSDKSDPDSPQAPTSGSAKSEILLIMQEETESISRGLGQEQRISEAPSNVYVITDEDIRHSGATDIPTLLRRVPGMEVMQMTGADFDVSVRGNNQTAANHLLVLVDGRPIYEYAFGTVFWTLLPVTLPEIKKIEVMKGPSAAIYGFNAFDGVVNIVTKSPQEMKGNTNGTFAQFGGGEFGTIRSTLIQSGTHGDFGYRLSFGHDQSQQWSNRDALALRSNKANLQTEYSLRDNSKILLSGGIVDSNRFDGLVFDVNRESSKVSNGYVNAAYERPNFFIRSSWTRWDRDQLPLHTPPVINDFLTLKDRDGNSKEAVRNDVYTTWIQHQLDLTSINRFMYGLNFIHNASSHVNVFDQAASENRLGLYVQDELRATNTISLVAGLRWDLHNELNPTYSPRLAIIYKPHEDHTFRISGSVAYRPPNLLETHLQEFATIQSPVIPLQLTNTTIGSHNLNPEKIVSYEAGYQGWYFKHRVRIRADVFYNHISDLIGGVGTNVPGVFTFANGGQVDLYGGEAGLEFLATSWLSGFLNYSTVQVHQTSDLVSAQAFNTTRGAPPYKISAGLRGEWNNGFSAEALVHHVAAASYPVSGAFAAFFNFPPLPSPPFPPGTVAFPGAPPPPDNRVGAYTLLNMRGAYRFWRERAEVAISIFNALNDHHKENPTGEEIGSRVMGWLTLRY